MLYRLFVKYYQKIGILPPLPDPLPRQKTWRVPTGGPMKKYSNKRILLVGDAAGFVTPLMGEGIPYAMWSGHIAAYTLKRFFDGKIPFSKVSSDYSKSCLRYFGREILVMAKLQVFLQKNLKIFFKLAQHDQILREIPEDIVLKGFNPLKGLPLIFKRIMIGILRGYLWKQ
jgi:flavin-dependent dehydrogenase